MIARIFKGTLSVAFFISVCLLFLSFFAKHSFAIEESSSNNEMLIWKEIPSPSRTHASSLSNVVTTNSSGNSSNVLIIVNNNSQESKDVGLYYQTRRNVPSKNIVYVNTTTDLTISYANYLSQIADPVRTYMDSNGIKTTILYIVTTYGIPYKITDTGSSVDTYLADLYNVYYSSAESNKSKMPDKIHPYSKVNFSTYSNSVHYPGVHFDNSYNYYLTMRLDGPSAKIAKGLVDKAIYAEKYLKPTSGKGYMSSQPYLLPQPGETTGGYSDATRTALCAPIITAGYQCIKDGGHTGGPNPLWHVSAGNTYSNIWSAWLPGSVPMHFQSFTAKRTIRDTTDDLFVPNVLAADATATWGTTEEPYANFVPQPIAIYDYFLNGNALLSDPDFNLAESIYLSATSLK